MKHGTTKSEWVVVRSFFSLTEAQMVKSILEAEGLDVLLPDEHVLGIKPGHETALGGARVMVRATDVEQVQSILRAMDESEEQVIAGVRQQ